MHFFSASSLSDLTTGSMRTCKSLPRTTFLLPILLLLICPAPAIAGSDYDFGSHPRFVCTLIPLDADTSCFPMGGQSMGGAGPSGAGHHGTTGGPPTGWRGMTEEAKATILHLRESLVQQKETILDQRETIRELTAKLTLCEGFGRGMTAHSDDHHGTVSNSHLGGTDSHHVHSDNRVYGTQQGNHGNDNLTPEVPHYSSVGGHRPEGGPSNNNNQGKDKHTTPGDVNSSPEQMERMLQALKERLENLQKRNSSSTLKDLLQRKITALEQQLQRHTAALNGPEHHHEESGHHDDSGHHDGVPGDDRHPNDRREEAHEEGHHVDGAHSEEPGDGHTEDDTHHDNGDRDDSDEGHRDDSQYSNEAESHRYVPRTGYRTTGSRSGLHTNKLEAMLNQLHLAGSSSKSVQSPDAFQIGFPMRTNYMYGRLKRTLPHEIFALTLCLWIKAGVGPGLGTPFSYSAPGQANELVLIEWGNNPMELLIDDKAVSLPLSLSDRKWNHVCVTWSTRDGQWEAFQDGVLRGSGKNLSAWHPIKPGGIFILGQEQDTLGGRFDASQSFVGEISDLQMWSHVLTAGEIYSLASCGSHLSGDVITWSEMEVELHGGVTKYPFDPCH